MAIRIELPKELVQAALDQKIASTKRAHNTASNKLIKDALDTELSAYTAARASLTEIK